MLNMQNVFLVASKSYSEKQAGIMFFIYGLSQFIFQTPAGYLMDNSNRKLLIFGAAGVATTILTLITVLFAEDYGGNYWSMVFVKLIQGAVAALIPTGLNSVTQGIVGAGGMTSQVSTNEAMNHLGTSILCLIGSMIAYDTYPDVGILFIMSPLACLGFVLFLSKIKPGDIDHDAARGLSKQKGDQETGQQANTLSSVFRDPLLVIYVIIIFSFHLSNATILPLVMQTLAIGDGRLGILMSAMCIIVAQGFMVGTAKICGTYAGVYGRKPLFLIGFFALPIRCALVAFLIHTKDGYEEDTGGHPQWIDNLTLSTQILDGIASGVFGTMYVLVTSDISDGKGNFSLTLGLTTSAMCIGSTISGYLGQALAQDLGYSKALSILGGMALIPALLYLFIMPETLKKEESESDSGENQPLLTST